MNIHPETKLDVVVSEHTEENDSAQHRSITTMSQKHGYANSYFFKAMEILAQEFQILF